VRVPWQTMILMLSQACSKCLGNAQRLAGQTSAHLCPALKTVIPKPTKLQVREVRIPWQEATGPCKARHLAQHLWNGEEFHLQIDSHMRFVPGWDSKLKHMLQQAEQMASFGKAVISSYPPAYEVCVLLSSCVGLPPWSCRLVQQSDSLRE